MKNFCIACGHETEQVMRKVIRGGERITTACSFCWFETEMMYETGRMIVKADWKMLNSGSVGEWVEVPEGTLLIAQSDMI